MSSTSESVYPKYEATEIKNWSWIHLPGAYFFVLKGVTQFGIAISLVGCGSISWYPPIVTHGPSGLNAAR